MNKSQLIESINKLPDDIEFVVAQDAEGNSFSDLEGVSVEYVIKDHFAVGNYDSIFSEEDIAEDFPEEEGQIPDEFQAVAVIWRV